MAPAFKILTEGKCTFQHAKTITAPLKYIVQCKGLCIYYVIAIGPGGGVSPIYHNISQFFRGGSHHFITISQLVLNWKWQIIDVLSLKNHIVWKNYKYCFLKLMSLIKSWWYSDDLGEKTFSEVLIFYLLTYFNSLLSFRGGRGSDQFITVYHIGGGGSLRGPKNYHIIYAQPLNR